MPARFIGGMVIGLSVLCGDATLARTTNDFVPLGERTDRLVASIEAQATGAASGSVEVSQCATYPYGRADEPATSASVLLGDLAQGLRTGLRCLSGLGPMGRLHQYHEYQAHRLLKLFESPRTKTFSCVDDAMFATAVATSPDGLERDDPLFAQLRRVEYPAVILDTYRLGGLLSQRYDDDTYRRFFHLADDQIVEHRSGQPIRAPNLHRYRDRGALLFHEVVHWLGHEHSAIYPDLAHLYETCCFGGSDYIDDPDANRTHQQTACNILKDDALWSVGHYPYKQMRVWRYKGYDGFKSRMRADYAE